jgi:hypothetical protein
MCSLSCGCSRFSFSLLAKGQFLWQRIHIVTLTLHIQLNLHSRAGRQTPDHFSYALAICRAAISSASLAPYKSVLFVGQTLHNVRIPTPRYTHILYPNISANCCWNLSSLGKNSPNLVQHYKVWAIVYNIQTQSISFRICPSCNRHINAKTLCFGSRLCFFLQERNTKPVGPLRSSYKYSQPLGTTETLTSAVKLLRTELVLKHTTITRAININWSNHRHIMQNHKTRTEEPNTTNIECGGAANLQGITTCY